MIKSNTKEYRKNYQKQYNLNRIKNRQCIHCGKKSISKCFCPECLKKENLKSIENTKKVKKDVIIHYGGKCNCCNETNIAFLVIDHINNDGNIHRKKIFGKNVGQAGKQFYKWIIKNNYPLNLQVLCFNCNWGKHHNNGICPHKNINNEI